MTVLSAVLGARRGPGAEERPDPNNQPPDPGNQPAEPGPQPREPAARFPRRGEFGQVTEPAGPASASTTIGTRNSGVGGRSSSRFISVRNRSAFVSRHFEDQFVVDLDQEPRPVPLQSGPARSIISLATSAVPAWQMKLNAARAGNRMRRTASWPPARTRRIRVATRLVQNYALSPGVFDTSFPQAP